MTALLTVLGTLAVGLLLTVTLSRRAPNAPVAAARLRWWVLAHHAAVVLAAAATGLALLLPPGVLGGQGQSPLWGGYLGHSAVLGFFAVLASLALTLLLSPVLRRVRDRRARAGVVGAVWTLTLLLVAAVALVVLAGPPPA